MKNELEPELVPEVKAVAGGQFELEKEPPIPNLINHQNRANHQKKQKTISPDKFDPIEATTGSHSDGDLDRARNGGITFGEEEIVLTSTELQNKSPKGREDKSPLGGIPDFFSSLMKNGGGIGNPGEGILLNSVIRSVIKSIDQSLRNSFFDETEKNRVFQFLSFQRSIKKE